ncbi:GIY-YIG nuclease family protein [Streptomyces albus]|uniref:GIY-YIG nuclease family protein n=1 Tax=Streptomyces albus TaxID=1888 RepID=UPI0033ECD6B8
MTDAWSGTYGARPTALYRLYDVDGRLLYAGISTNPEARWTQHETHKTWWHLVARKTVEWHEDREAALRAEILVAETEKPRFDTSSKKTRRRHSNEYDCTSDVQRVVNGLTSALRRGKYEAGSQLWTGDVARMFGVARASASIAMGKITQDLLRPISHGRYTVEAPAEPSSATDWESRFPETYHAS